MVTVRTDLEAAMGAALTSRTARDLILGAPADFAAHFTLTEEETAQLAAMAADLAELMPGFVHKRERGLRRAMAVTLSVLPDEATALVEDYTEAFPPVDSAAADSLRFAGYLVSAISQLPDKFPNREIILDIARLERMRLRASHTEWPLRPESEQDPLDPRRLDEDRPLWLCRSAAIERFSFDVRTVRADRPAGTHMRLRPDPACLLCFQRPGDGEVVVVRLDEESARMAELIARRPGDITARELTGAGSRTSLPALGKLVSLGVVKEAAS
jgi:hypothetical protein